MGMAAALLQPTIRLENGIPQAFLIMESWLVDVKRVKIPRPKFGSNGRCHPYPSEPPKDYFYDDSRHEDLKMRTSSGLAKATEDLRRAIQEKL